MSKHITYIVKDTTTGETYEFMAKDRGDALEGVADFYDLDYDNLEVV